MMPPMTPMGMAQATQPPPAAAGYIPASSGPMVYPGGYAAYPPMPFPATYPFMPFVPPYTAAQQQQPTSAPNAAPAMYAYPTVAYPYYGQMMIPVGPMQMASPVNTTTAAPAAPSTPDNNGPADRSAA